MIENLYDISFVARLARREKQIQQHYRPVIGVHKWFARRPGSLFRALLVSEFTSEGSLHSNYYQGHNFQGLVVGDPFMGGGTPLFEANRLGCHVVGADVNAMSYWVVRSELAKFNEDAFSEAAQDVVEQVESELGFLYRTTCLNCGQPDVPVKYFLWVKQLTCEQCGRDVDLFTNYLVSKNQRHPDYVLICHRCGALNEVTTLDDVRDRQCKKCSTNLRFEGPAGRSKCTCIHCSYVNRYPSGESPPRHRLFAIEYHCESCARKSIGRFFKRADTEDLSRYAEAEEKLKASNEIFIPKEYIPPGDETDRLHRWGYGKYRDLFNARQLLGLNTLAEKISQIEDIDTRYALLTVFSDTIRYQNMLCRYDTYALKILDIFSVHGYPVSLRQCENSLLGTPGVGSGSYLHFIDKYRKAKTYCRHPFEFTLGRNKKRVFTKGESIQAEWSDKVPTSTESRMAYLSAVTADQLNLPSACLDAVFTDPPYFANVQYAELMDFCYVWLKRHLGGEVPGFEEVSTRSNDELTVNQTAGRDICHFTEGLSRVFVAFTKALKHGAPFAFTYHHNDLEAYFPIAIALLDAGLVCTAVFPCPAEMGASIHISGTKSSTLDSILVCRTSGEVKASHFIPPQDVLEPMLVYDLAQLKEAGQTLSLGDVICLLYGHLTRLVVWHERLDWNRNVPVEDKLSRVQGAMMEICPPDTVEPLAKKVWATSQDAGDKLPLFSADASLAYGEDRESNLSFNLQEA